VIAPAGAAELARFEARGPVAIRPCAAEDLPALEWRGAFTHHRELIAEAFARQRRGEVVMLVADVVGWPVGQAWVDLTRLAAEGAGMIWAVRVADALRGSGIGTRLLAAAERVIAARGLAAAEVRVELRNADARRLYERLGYRLAGRVQETYGYTPPGGAREELALDEWVLRKPLRGAAGRGAEARP
jgi:ribosomal protein S18 acetylase RimI-like enzyme